MLSAQWSGMKVRSCSFRLDVLIASTEVRSGLSQSRPLERPGCCAFGSTTGVGVKAGLILLVNIQGEQGSKKKTGQQPDKAANQVARGDGPMQDLSLGPEVLLPVHYLLYSATQRHNILECLRQ